MSTVEEIREAILKLPREQIEQISEWTRDHLEDQLELTDEIKAKLEQSRREIAAGQFKTAPPKSPTPKSK
ncbi:MAG: hypothetical protein ABR514_08395 [Chthoniobacterales bacterium]